MSKRRLSDLYVRGEELTLDDGEGDPVTVWIQKLNPLEQAEAAREADKARSKVLAAKKDPDSDVWQAAHTEADETTDRDVLVNYLLMEERMKARPAIEAKVAAEDEWSKDNYLEGLRDLWDSGLRARHVEDPDDPDANRVFVELNRFDTQVGEELEDRLAPEQRELEELPLAELQSRSAEKAMELRANAVWADEFYRTSLYYAVRDSEERKSRYFESREEIDALAGETYMLLRQKFDEITVDGREGKDLAASPTSSPPPEPPVLEETEPSSGLVGANA